MFQHKYGAIQFSVPLNSPRLPLSFLEISLNMREVLKKDQMKNRKQDIKKQNKRILFVRQLTSENIINFIQISPIEYEIPPPVLFVYTRRRGGFQSVDRLCVHQQQQQHVSNPPPYLNKERAKSIPTIRWQWQR